MFVGRWIVHQLQYTTGDLVVGSTHSPLSKGLHITCTLWFCKWYPLISRINPNLYIHSVYILMHYIYSMCLWWVVTLYIFIKEDKLHFLIKVISHLISGCESLGNVAELKILREWLRCCMLVIKERSAFVTKLLSNLRPSPPPTLRPTSRKVHCKLPGGLCFRIALGLAI